MSSSIEQKIAYGCFDLANEFIKKIKTYENLSPREKSCIHNLFIFRAKKFNRYIHPEAERSVLKKLYK